MFIQAATCMHLLACYVTYKPTVVNDSHVDQCRIVRSKVFWWNIKRSLQLVNLVICRIIRYSDVYLGYLKIQTGV